MNECLYITTQSKLAEGRYHTVRQPQCKKESLTTHYPPKGLPNAWKGYTLINAGIRYLRHKKKRMFYTPSSFLDHKYIYLTKITK